MRQTLIVISSDALKKFTNEHCSIIPGKILLSTDEV